MGSCLQMFAKKQQQPLTKPNPTHPPDTDRRMLSKTLAEKEKQQSVCKSNIEIQSNSSVRETKIFFKTKSTALFSTDSDRKHSSILQYTLDHENMIVKSTGEGASVGIPQQYYTLVDKIAFVRKTMDCLKVTSPDGQSEINCQPQFLFSTLTVSEGKPVDCIEQVAPNKFIQTESSPIKLRLKLKCQSCKKKIKATFCKGVVHLNMMVCPSCDTRDNWSLQDITCNYPVWGGGAKIDNHQKMDKAPNIIRVMGCVICLKFSNLQHMKCGCLICKPCLSAQQNLRQDQQCWMCEGSSAAY